MGRDYRPVRVRPCGRTTGRRAAGRESRPAALADEPHRGAAGLVLDHHVIAATALGAGTNPRLRGHGFDGRRLCTLSDPRGVKVRSIVRFLGTRSVTAVTGAAFAISFTTSRGTCSKYVGRFRGGVFLFGTSERYRSAGHTGHLVWANSIWRLTFRHDWVRNGRRVRCASCAVYRHPINIVLAELATARYDYVTLR